MNKIIQILSFNSLSLPMNHEASRRQLWLEVLGFFVAGWGLFTVLCLLGYDYSDMQTMSSGATVKNWGGPVGAFWAHGLRSGFGYMSFLLPVGMMLWGVWFARGKVSRPDRKIVATFFFMLVILAALVEVFFPQSVYSYGNGGLIGGAFGKNLVGLFGFAGALVFLTVAAVSVLITTRFWSFRKVAVADPAVEFRKTTAEPSTKKSSKKTQSLTDADDDNSEGDLQDEDEDESLQRPGFEIDLEPSAKSPGKPDIKIFKSKPMATTDSTEEAEVMAQLTEKLAEFKVSGEVTKVTSGPVVKTYEYEPSAGTKVAKIESLQSDLARLLTAESLRVVPVPGSTTVGFEIPNQERQVIHFGNLVNDSQFKSRDYELPIAMGVDCFGKPVIEDLTEMPHLLVAGSTGSGKSVFINTLIASLLTRNTAKEMRLVLIDPKMVELGAFNGAAHMACPVVTDVARDGLPLLERLVWEMEERYKKLKSVGAKNLQAFNEIVKTRKKGQFKKFPGKWQPMPYVVVVVDEFADMMMSLGKEAEQHIARLAQKARAAGIHLVIATQRPSVKVVTGLIKANFPTRISFRVTSAVDSRTILDQGGAETLLGKGDMLYLSTKGISRLHSGYLSEDEIGKLVKACKAKKF